MHSTALLLGLFALICSAQACYVNATGPTSDPVSATLPSGLNCTFDLSQVMSGSGGNQTFFAIYSKDHNMTASNSGLFSVQTDTTEEQYACLGPLVDSIVQVGVADMTTPGPDDEVDYQYYIVTGSCDASSIDWDSGTPIWVWVLVVVGVILVIVLVVAVIAGYVFWKKKKEAEESDLHTFEDA